MTPASATDFGQALKQLLLATPGVIGALAKGAEASPALLQQALDRPGLLSLAQWAELHACLGVAGGVPAAWTSDHLAALQSATRHKPTSRVLEAARHANMRKLTDAAGRGSMRRIADRLNVALAIVSDLNRGARPFTARRAREMEVQLGLAEGWFDREDAVPPDVIEHLSSSPGGVTLIAQAQPAEPKPGGGADTGAGMHALVLGKYRELQARGLVSEQLAYEFLGKLLELERAVPAA